MSAVPSQDIFAAEPTYSYGPQPLEGALETFVRENGLQLLYTTRLTEGKASRGAPANLSAVDTLRELLRGTGLGFAFIDDRAVTIFEIKKAEDMSPEQSGMGNADQQSPDALANSRSDEAKRETQGMRPQTGAAGASAPMPDNLNIRTNQEDKMNQRQSFWARILGVLTGNVATNNRASSLNMAQLIALCGSMAAAGGACAQQAAAAMPRANAENGSTLEEIIVTAEKREADMQKVSEDIQVFSGEQLKQEGKKRIDDILSTVPGIHQQDGSQGATFSFRGVDSGLTGQLQPGATVAVLIDGVYQDRPEMVRASTLDLARTEVLWGTQSTTLGPSSIAGAISLVTNKPEFDALHLGGSIDLSNYNSLSTEAVVNMPLSGDQALRLAYSSSRRDGYYSSNAGADNSDTVRLRYRYKPTEDLDLLLTLQRESVGGNGITWPGRPAQGVWEGYNVVRDSNLSANTCDGAGQPSCYLTTMGGPVPLLGLAPGAWWTTLSNPWNDGHPKNLWPLPPNQNTVVKQATAELDWRTSAGTVTLLPSIENTHYDYLGGFSGSGTRASAGHAAEKTYQFEARLASKDDSRLKWLVGGYFYYSDNQFSNGPSNGEGESIRFANDPGPGGYTCPYSASQLANPNAPYNPGSNPAVIGNQDASGTVIPAQNCYRWSKLAINSLTTTSVFGNVVWPVTDTLRLIGGLRYSRDSRVVQNNAHQRGGGAVGTINGPTAAYVFDPKYHATWQHGTYRVGVEYDLLPQAMLYTTVATGYQPGNVDTRAGNVSVRNLNNQYTLGFKSRFLADRLQVNVEAFWLNFRDRPFNDSINVGFYDFGFNSDSPRVDPGLTTLDPNLALVTAPKQTSRGADLDIAWAATPNDRLNLSVEFLNSAYGANPDSPRYSTAQLLTAAGISNPTAAQLAAVQALYARYLLLNENYAGVILQDSPRFTGNFAYQHRFNLWNGSTLTPQLDIFFKGTYWVQGDGLSVGNWGAASAFEPGSPLKQGAYHLLNANLTWQSADRRFTVTGHVRNIENKAILSNIGTDFSSGLTFVSLDAPRTFGISVNAAL
jgi:iron complex outermembrane receptor protein